jgi:hypothetical protein
MPYTTQHVLAGAYRGKHIPLDALRTHTVDDETGEPLCGRVKAENLTQVDEGTFIPTCSRCRKLDPRFKGGY